MYFETKTVLTNLEVHFQTIIEDWVKRWGSPEISLCGFSFENMPGGSRVDQQFNFQLISDSSVLIKFFSGGSVVSADMADYIDKAGSYVFGELFELLSGGVKQSERATSNPLKLCLNFREFCLEVGFDKCWIPNSLLGTTAVVPFSRPPDCQYDGVVNCKVGFIPFISSPDELKRLVVGQVLLMNQKISDPLIMSLSDVPVARVYMGGSEGRKALVVDEVINEEC